MKKELVIVGGGAAGLAAALQARREGMRDILLIERRPELGGVLNQCIHHGFGLHYFQKDLTGPEYAHYLIEALREKQIEYWTDSFVLSLGENKTLTVSNYRGIFEIEAGALILATGCRERSLREIEVAGSRPSGIFTAGFVQEMFNRKGLVPGKNVVIMGAGDIGLIVARRLALNGIRVQCIIEREVVSSGLRRNLMQCAREFEIPILYNTVVTDVSGIPRLEKIRICPLDHHGQRVENTARELFCDTLITAIGLIPDLKLPRSGGLDILPNCRLTVDSQLQSSREGIFVCGNLRQVHSLVDYASREGERAAGYAAAYLSGRQPSVLAKNDSMELGEEKRDVPDSVLTCLGCPRGCLLRKSADGVWGQRCQKGEHFFQQEQQAALRMLSGTVRLNIPGMERLPVRTSGPVPQHRLRSLLQYIQSLTIDPPVRINDVLLHLPREQVDVISCRDVL